MIFLFSVGQLGRFHLFHLLEPEHNSFCPTLGQLEGVGLAIEHGVLDGRGQQAHSGDPTCRSCTRKLRTCRVNQTMVLRSSQRRVIEKRGIITTTLFDYILHFSIIISNPFKCHFGWKQSLFFHTHILVYEHHCISNLRQFHKQLGTQKQIFQETIPRTEVHCCETCLQSGEGPQKQIPHSPPFSSPFSQFWLGPLNVLLFKRSDLPLL